MHLAHSPSFAPDALDVVVIDDSKDIRLLIGRALERSRDFCVVADVGDGKQGVAAVKAMRPHLVLLDIAMPVMDGLQALTQIIEACPDAIVIIFSGFPTTNALTQQALDMGAHGFVDKNGHFKALPQQLRTLLAAIETAA